MKRKMLLLCATTIMMANRALALEFRQMGDFRMGGAGVARTLEGTAADWKLGKVTFGEEKTDIAHPLSATSGYYPTCRRAHE